VAAATHIRCTADASIASNGKLHHGSLEAKKYIYIYQFTGRANTRRSFISLDHGVADESRRVWEKGNHDYVDVSYFFCDALSTEQERHATQSADGQRQTFIEPEGIKIILYLDKNWLDLKK